jgi:hypothetical protein
MRWKLPATLVAVLLLVWVAMLWVTGRRPVAPPLPPYTARPAAHEKHYATPAQLTASGDMAARTLGPLGGVTQNGSRVGWEDLARRRPVVLVFIKKGCPCSVEFEPYFHRLYRAYPECAAFAGVIDGGTGAARDYAEANHVPYPVLADPGRELISRFRAENGAYVALLTPEGVLDTLWPGCSAGMMRELSHRVAELAGREEQPIETSGLPAALTAGCPFSG